jgi:hypothetical protein
VTRKADKLISVEPATESLLKALGTLASSGVLGALLVVVLWAYYKKDKALLEQSEAFRAQVIGIQREVIMAVNKMGELVDFIERREQEREREPGRRVTR